MKKNTIKALTLDLKEDGWEGSRGFVMRDVPIPVLDEKKNPSDGEAVMTLKSWEDISPILPWAWSKKLFIK